MNIHQLAVFHAVAENSSVTRAAEKLFISQPAVSKQLRELERSLGMALFHRLSTGVRLTEAGELLLGYSRQIFELETEAEAALRELHNLERGRLRASRRNRQSRPFSFAPVFAMPTADPASR